MPWQQTRPGMYKFVTWCSHYYSCTIIIYFHKNKIMGSLSMIKVSVSLCNNGNLSQFQFELKYCIISIICDIHKNYSMISKFCIEHSNIIAVLCAKFWNHGINNRLAVDSQVLSRFELKRDLQYCYERQFPDPLPSPLINNPHRDFLSQLRP